MMAVLMPHVASADITNAYTTVTHVKVRSTGSVSYLWIAGSGAESSNIIVAAAATQGTRDAVNDCAKSAKIAMTNTSKYALTVTAQGINPTANPNYDDISVTTASEFGCELILKP